MKTATVRFILAAVLIAATSLFLEARGRDEVFPPRLAFDTFPVKLGAWSGTDVSLSKDVLDVLGPGDFLLRIYENEGAPEPNIDLFMAYFRSQRAGDTIHSPKNCLPGAGWTPVEAVRKEIALPGHRPFRINRYIIAKGDSRKLVLYWYWAHDRGVASEYWAKVYLVADSMRMNRSDGALVRISTDLQPGETADQGEQRVFPFTRDVVPLLNQYIPR
jgi:EpsI family protein